MVSSFHGFVVMAAALAVLLIRAQDPVKVDAKHYKAEMENDHGRVLRIQYPPSEYQASHQCATLTAIGFSTGF